eukprot:TRINITY_DN6333_c0_g1_i2.p1 TRINITY_DN6333_c0_g1~~TRINITY_DN6333_c0_g1_i2.p1  ORF type:complete len:442 (+),score=114.54 TRINITY_DN6333_c0_g1_i2:102-1427(+)
MLHLHTAAGVTGFVGVSQWYKFTMPHLKMNAAWSSGKWKTFAPVTVQSLSEDSPYLRDSFSRTGGDKRIPDCDIALHTIYTGVGGLPPTAESAAKYMAEGTRPSPSMPMPRPEVLGEGYRKKVLSWDDPENVGQLNNVSNDISSMSFYPNPRQIYDNMVTGAYVPPGTRAPWVMRTDCLPNAKLKQISGEDLFLNATGQFYALKLLSRDPKFGKLTKKKQFHRSSHVFQAEHYPGWLNEIDMCGAYALSATQQQLTCNAKCEIFRIGYENRNNDASPTDRGFYIQVTTMAAQQTVAHPYQGAAVQDTLGKVHDLHYQDHYSDLPVGTTETRKLRTNTLQEAIILCESMGMSWTFHHEHPPSVGRDQHALYTHNFPYRGQKKHPASLVKQYKRQEGGNEGPKSSEDMFHPYEMEHFKEHCGHPCTRISHLQGRGMTEEELFA